SLADWPAVLATIEAAAGPIDGVVFVAGTAVFGPSDETPDAAARAVFELNFWSLAHAAQAAAARWTAEGRTGSFVGVLSIAGRRAVPQEAWYGASKAAAARFLECLQLEHDPAHIRVVPAFPGLL